MCDQFWGRLSIHRFIMIKKSLSAKAKRIHTAADETEYQYPQTTQRKQRQWPPQQNGRQAKERDSGSFLSDTTGSIVRIACHFYRALESRIRHTV